MDIEQDGIETYGYKGKFTKIIRDGVFYTIPNVKNRFLRSIDAEKCWDKLKEKEAKAKYIKTINQIKNGKGQYHNLKPSERKRIFETAKKEYEEWQQKDV